MRLLLVCQANIVRSACAELLARTMARGARSWEIESAGVRALAGAPVDPVAASVLSRRGIDTAAHRARQATAHVVRRADLVLTFEASQRAWLLDQHPHLVRSTFTIRRAAALLADRPRHGEPLGFLAHDSQPYAAGDDFADPYGQGVAATARAVDEIASLLRPVLRGLGALRDPGEEPRRRERVSMTSTRMTGTRP
jgi:protein-tyrosine-phosphatase